VAVDALSFLDLTESDRFLIGVIKESDYCAANNIIFCKASGVDEVGLVI